MQLNFPGLQNCQTATAGCISAAGFVLLSCFRDNRLQNAANRSKSHFGNYFEYAAHLQDMQYSLQKKPVHRATLLVAQLPSPVRHTVRVTRVVAFSPA